MIYLNGLPVIFGATLLHIAVINFMAIFIEYKIIKRKYVGSRLKLRVVMANLISVLAGTFVFYMIPENMNVMLAQMDQPDYVFWNKVALGLALLGLFLTNVIVETPAYLIGNKIDRSTRRLLGTIFLANLITNIPVVLIYLSVANL